MCPRQTLPLTILESCLNLLDVFIFELGKVRTYPAARLEVFVITVTVFWR